MSWLWGAGLGFLRGGPLGALLGGAAGHFLTKTAKKQVRRRLPGVDNENLFVTCLIVVLARLSLVKGHITATEVEAIYRFFVRNLDYNHRDLKQINRVIEETLRVKPDFPPVIEQFLEAGKGNYRSLLLTLTYQQSLIEKSLNEDMQKAINEIALLLGLSYKEHDLIRSRYSLGQLTTPYSILGVTEDDSNEVIQKAYRRKLVENHPDRVVHLGEEQAEAAHVEFLRVQGAFQELERVRRF